MLASCRSKIYFYGGIFYATTESERGGLPSSLLPETMSPHSSTPDLSDRFYVLDTETWLLDEIRAQGSDSGGARGSKGKVSGRFNFLATISYRD